MIKIKILGVIVLALVIFLAVFLFIVGFFKSKKAALRIESSPTSSIYLDNVQVGQTPFETTWDSGEVVLKIVPQSSNLAFYETKIFLTSGVRTVVRWFFGESQETSMGEIISFEKTSSDEVSISVVSEPDGAQVSLDGRVEGFTPIKISQTFPGEHQLAISAAGFLQRVFSVKAAKGYRLTSVVKLAKVSQEPILAAEEEKEEKVMIEIDQTSKGFLRVREKPNTNSSEITKVKPGETFELLEEDKKSGWYKIVIDQDKTGWVSGEYVKLLE